MPGLTILSSKEVDNLISKPDFLNKAIDSQAAVLKAFSQTNQQKHSSNSNGHGHHSSSSSNPLSPTEQPQRVSTTNSCHKVLYMPSRVQDIAGIKLVSVPLPNSQAPEGLPASTIVVDEKTGVIRGMVNSRKLTAIRNACGSALFLQQFPFPKTQPPTNLLIFGSGLQSSTHAKIFLTLFPTIKTVTFVVRRETERIKEAVLEIRKEFSSSSSLGGVKVEWGIKGTLEEQEEEERREREFKDTPVPLQVSPSQQQQTTTTTTGATTTTTTTSNTNSPHIGGLPISPTIPSESQSAGTRTESFSSGVESLSSSAISFSDVEGDDHDQGLGGQGQGYGQGQGQGGVEDLEGFTVVDTPPLPLQATISGLSNFASAATRGIQIPLFGGGGGSGGSGRETTQRGQSRGAASSIPVFTEDDDTEAGTGKRNERPSTPTTLENKNQTKGLTCPPIQEFNLPQTIHNSQIILTCTPSHSPLFASTHVTSSTRLILIGSYTPQMHEVTTELVHRAGRIIVDWLEGVKAEAGEIIDAGVQNLVELGDVMGWKDGDERDWLMGEVKGSGDVLMYKSVGVGIQDVAIAQLLLDQAEKAGSGTVIKDYD